MSLIFMFDLYIDLLNTQTIITLIFYYIFFITFQRVGIYICIHITHIMHINTHTYTHTYTHAYIYIHTHKKHSSDFYCFTLKEPLFYCRRKFLLLVFLLHLSDFNNEAAVKLLLIFALNLLQWITLYYQSEWIWSSESKLSGA